MKRFFWAASAAVVVAGLSPTQVSAQLPALPAVPGAPVAAAPAAVAAPGPRVGIFQRMKLGMGGCLEKIRNTPLGQLLNNATKPLSMLTGGVIPTLDKKPTDADTKKPGVAGAAALGKKDAAEAAERRAAVKFLGTLDCRYYPEATAGLTAALRTDPSECVRYEAALALSRGCCCNKITLQALAASVSGLEPDGNPAERSARVRCTAAVALEKCLACYKEVGPPEEPKKGGGGGEGKGEGAKKDEADDKGKLTKGDMGPPSVKDVDKAREILAAFQDAYATAEAMHGTATAAGARNTSGILEVGGNEPRTPAVANAAFRTPTPGMTPAPRMTDPAVAAKSVVPAPTLTPVPAPTVSPAKFKEADPVPTTPALLPTTPVVPPVPGPVVPVVDPASKATEPTLTPAAADDADAKAVEVLIHKVLLSEAAADQHAAIRDLVKYDWTAHPLVASCLVAGAKSTADAAVRVDCIRHMAHHQMAHKDVLAALEALCSDSDQWVKDEAAKAMETLKK